MKHGKVPTRKQKTFIQESGFVPENWLVVKEFPRSLEIVSSPKKRWKESENKNHQNIITGGGNLRVMSD